MRKLYGEQYESRYEDLSKVLAPNKSVVELCAGDGFFYEHYLQYSNPDYTAIEWNGKFALYLKELGANVIEADLNTADIPPADIILIHASLYQFQDYKEIIRKMFAAARHQLIVAEPIENFASDKNKLKATIAAHLSNPGDGPKYFRFNRQTLLDAFEGYPEPAILEIPDNKEIILVFQKEPQ